MRRMLFAWGMAAVAALAPGWALAGEAEDEVIANQIARNLKESGRLQNYRIGVAFRDGTAWLNGSVTNADQLVAALEVAQQTEGVNQVVNRLETKPAASTASKQPISARLRANRAALRSEGEEAAQGIQPNQDGIQLATSTVEEQMVRQQVAQRSTWPAVGPVAPQNVRMTQEQAMQQQMMQQQMAYQQQRAPQQRVAMAPQPPQVGQQATAQRSNKTPLPYARMARANTSRAAAASNPGFVPGTGAVTPARYDHAQMPNYAWPSYASHPNYAAVTYPKQYSPTAWPYIGPFYPYPQVPLGWRKVTLQWDDGWWMLDFHEKH